MSPKPSDSTCRLAIAPHDIAAWAVDGEPVEGLEDPGVHVATCGACTAAVESVGGAAVLGEHLRSGGLQAPASLLESTMRRVRGEAATLVVARTLGGGAVRLLAALPDYLGPATIPLAQAPGDAAGDTTADSTVDTTEFEAPPQP